MVTRDELYRLVWSEPMTKLAKRFEVSDSYLARMCKLLNVPRPGLGYWAKLDVGKAPPQTPLPEAEPGDPLEWVRDGTPPRVHRPKPVAPTKRSSPKKAVIPRDRVHALVREARGHFSHCRDDKEGTYLKPYKLLMADIVCSREGLDEALKLANDIYLALESLGHRVVIAPQNSDVRRSRPEEREAVGGKARSIYDYYPFWTPYRPTIVYIGSVPIGLTVIEMSEHVELRYLHGRYIRERDYVPSRRDGYTWTTHDDRPSGRMRLVAYAPYGRISWSKQWQETKTAGLSRQIAGIVANLEAAAPTIVTMLEEADRQADLRRQEYERQEDIRRRDEDRRRIYQSIKDSRSDLDNVIERWAELTGVERFLAGVEDRAAALPLEERESVLARLALARDFLGSQDPLDFIRDWRLPRERYAPRYSENEDITEVPADAQPPRGY